MAIIVKHREDGERYILLGTGYGAFKATRPSFFGGNLFPNEEEGEIKAAAICDKTGEIQWAYTDDLQVIEIDGQPVEKLL